VRVPARCSRRASSISRRVRRHHPFSRSRDRYRPRVRGRRPTAPGRNVVRRRRERSPAHCAIRRQRSARRLGPKCLTADRAAPAQPATAGPKRCRCSCRGGRGREIVGGPFARPFVHRRSAPPRIPERAPARHRQSAAARAAPFAPSSTRRAQPEPHRQDAVGHAAYGEPLAPEGSRRHRGGHAGRVARPHRCQRQRVRIDRRAHR